MIPKVFKKLWGSLTREGRGESAGENSNISDIKQGSKEKLGDFGERVVRKLLANDGFGEFFQVQNKSRNKMDGNTSKATENAQAAQKAVEQAELEGKVTYQKYDVYVGGDGH